MAKKPKYILVVGDVSVDVVQSFRNFEKDSFPDGELLLLVNNKTKVGQGIKKNRNYFDHVIELDEVTTDSITKGLLPYRENIIAVTCRSERAIPLFKKVTPQLAHLHVPTSESLEWSTDKLKMRQRFAAYAPEITPKFYHAVDSSLKTVKAIEKEVGYPLIIKPTGFAQSVFVTNVYHRDELIKGLENVFKKAKSLNGAYGDKDYYVLVEQLMEGSMYSLDAYIDESGKSYICPLVHVKTGKEIGFDDYFGYQQMTPSVINEGAQKQALEAARKAIDALGLKSTSAHVELYRTEHGWKIIEVGPRLGGFRHDMYKLSFGIDHAANDLRIRLGKKPILPNEILGYTATLKVFAKREGVINSIRGIAAVKKYKSFNFIDMHKKRGDKAVFAKNGGTSVFNVRFFNKDRAKLLADIRRMEQSVIIDVS